MIQVNTNHGAVPASGMIGSLAPIDLDGNGVRIDEVLKYIRNGVTLDRTGDALFTSEDIVELLNQLDRIPLTE